jgi:hypothetical protein
LVIELNANIFLPKIKAVEKEDKNKKINEKREKNNEEMKKKLHSDPKL